jgi:RHS repeat-associated protein
VWGEQFKITYDDAGFRSSLTYPNGIRAEYRYDKLGRRKRIAYRNKQGKEILSFGYSYDDLGNVITFSEGKKVTRFGYDALGRLASVKDAKGITTKFEYDKNDNLTRVEKPGQSKQKQIHNKKDQLISTGKASFKYDTEGRLVKIDRAKGKMRFDYYADNKLKAVKIGDSKRIEFKYDPLGARVLKSAPNGSSYYVYDLKDLLRELDENHRVKATYTHGPVMDEPLSVRRGQQSFFFHADGRGSIRLVTDSSGNPVDRIRYDPFGLIVMGDDSKHGVHRFAGGILDRETGLYYFRNRYYYPAIKRFITTDPLKYRAGQSNYYAYAQNNPTTYKDSMGLQSDSFLDDLSGLVSGVYEKGWGGYFKDKGIGKLGTREGREQVNTDANFFEEKSKVDIHGGVGGTFGSIKKFFGFEYDPNTGKGKFTGKTETTPNVGLEIGGQVGLKSKPPHEAPSSDEQASVSVQNDKWGISYNGDETTVKIGPINVSYNQKTGEINGYLGASEGGTLQGMDECPVQVDYSRTKSEGETPFWISPLKFADDYCFEKTGTRFLSNDDCE